MISWQLLRPLPRQRASSLGAGRGEVPPAPEAAEDEDGAAEASKGVLGGSWDPCNYL